MENKHLPGQEPETLRPDPAAEELPVIEDLTFGDAPEAPVIEELVPQELVFDAPVPEEIPAAEEIPIPEELPVAEEILIPEEIIVAEEVPVPEEVPTAEEVLTPEEVPTAEEFAVPEEAAIVPEQPVYEPLPFEPETSPVLPEEPAPAEEIPASENPDAPVEDPALEILNDPEFAMPKPEEQPAEDTADQEYADAPPIPAPAEEEAAGTKKKKKAEKPRATLKGRPKRKKGEGLFGIPNILVTFVWLGLILAIGVTLGRMLWVCAADILAFGREDRQVTITVYEADTLEDVIDKLYDNGLIRYKSLFTLYAEISDAEEDIKPGIYDLNTRYDYHALVNFMSPSSTRSVIELTIPEGYTCRQIFALLEENRVCTAVDIASYAADGQLSDYWFLEDVERGSEYCLEGFLFPDTYQFYKNSTPKEALEKMLDNFGRRFTEEMIAQIDTLNAEVTGGGYGIREIVIVASLIEKESAAPAESPQIASVIYNRLHYWEYPALLNIDAAIVYAQGGDAEHIDTSIDSPYNTYLNTGLTPTPIANPGLSSLKAALNPDSTDYYFYVLNPDTGMHQFSKTQAEHDGWIAEFYH